MILPHSARVASAAQVWNSYPNRTIAVSTCCKWIGWRHAASMNDFTYFIFDYLCISSYNLLNHLLLLFSLFPYLFKSREISVFPPPEAKVSPSISYMSNTKELFYIIFLLLGLSPINSLEGLSNLEIESFGIF